MARLRSLQAPLPAMTAGYLLLASTLSLSAQEGSTIAGTVVEEGSGVPLEGATITVLEHGPKAEADLNGHFLLNNLAPGKITLRIDQPGYATVVEAIEIAPTEMLFYQVRLPRFDITLSELFVTAERRWIADGTSNPEVPRKSNARTAADLLAQVAGVQMSSPSGVPGTGTGIRMRGPSTIQGDDTPAVYLNGIRIDEGGGPRPGTRLTNLHVLQQIPAEEVERIQILKGPAAASRFPFGAAGVILIETRRGRDSAR